METKRIGRYEIETVLGQGGMGTVYSCRDTETGEKVALKVLAGGLTDDEERFRRFEQEVTALSRLDHENIVRLLGPLERDGDRVFFPMELFPGETLALRLRRTGPLPVTQALQIARTLLEALAAAHEAGVVHRDVKPSNILLDGDALKVTDFGLARMEDITRLTKTGQLMGTLEYMSPEQCEGAPIDARTDLYSAGIILFEMLAGAPPFKRTTAGTVLKGHLSEVPPSLDRIRADLPDGLADVVAKLLEKDPEDRFAGAREAAAALAAVPNPAVTVTFHPGSEPGGVASPPEVTRTMTDSVRARHGRPLLVGAAAVVFAVVVAGAISLLTGGESPRGTPEKTLESAHRALRDKDYEAFIRCFEPELIASLGEGDPKETFLRVAGGIDDFAYNLTVPPRGAVSDGLSIRVGSSPALATVFGENPGSALRVGLRSEEGGFRIARITSERNLPRPGPGGGPRGERSRVFFEGRVRTIFDNLDRNLPAFLGRRVSDPDKLEKLRERLKQLEAEGKITYRILDEESTFNAGRASVAVECPALARIFDLGDDRFVVEFDGRSGRGGRLPRIRPLGR